MSTKTLENFLPNVNIGGGGLPAGAIIPWASNSGTIPTGYLLCDGAAVSRTTYSALFAAIGITYGVGNGSTTFNLPPFQGQFLRGYQSGVSAEIGVSQSSQNLSHKHYVDTLAYYGTKADTGPGSANQNAASGQTYYQTSLEGGTEARPVNYAVQFLIKY